VTRLRAVRRRGKKSPKHPDRLWVPPVSYSVGTGGAFLPGGGGGVERLGRASDQLSTFVAKVKMNGAVPSLPPYAFMACTGTVSLYHTGDLSDNLYLL
jgi:hypothetical protein